MRFRIATFLLLSLFSISVMGQEAPDFKVTTTDGDEIELYKNYLDKGVTVVIEFFFVNCPPCNDLAPHLATLYNDLESDNVKVEFLTFSVLTSDTDEDINGFKTLYGHSWPAVGDTGGSRDIQQTYIDLGLYFGTPTTIVIDPDGTIRGRVRANTDEAWVVALNESILESQAAFNENNMPPPPPATAVVSGGIATAAKGEALGGVTINISVGIDTTITTDSNGAFQTAGLLIDQNYTLEPQKNDDFVNGVTTLDIVTISRHILGISPFAENYQFIAADVNGSNTITTFDIVIMRQLILGLIDEFPQGKSWLFDPPITILNTLNELQALSFSAVKVGDVNASASISGLLNSEDRGAKEIFQIHTENLWINAGETLSVPFKATQMANIAGFQFTLEFDEKAIQLNGLEQMGLKQMTVGNFNLEKKAEGHIQTSWNGVEEDSDEMLFSLSFTALESGYLHNLLSLTSNYTKAEAYNLAGETLAIDLNFAAKENNSMVKLFPNPTASDQVNVTFDLVEAKEVTVIITSSNGQMVAQQNHKLSAGNQQLSVDVTNLPTGIFTINLMSDKDLIKSLPLIKK